MKSKIKNKRGAQDASVFASKDLLGEGTALYQRAQNECLPEHRELMVKVWSPTPWMLDVVTEGREDEIWQWCYRHFGNESSPIHGKDGTWHRANVTMDGRTWFGFKSKMMLELFEAHFPSPNADVSNSHHDKIS